MVWEEMSYNRYKDRKDELWDKGDENPSYIISTEELIRLLFLNYIEE